MSAHFICSFRNQSGFMPYFIFFKPLCPFHLFLTHIFSDCFPRGGKLRRIERWKRTPSVSRRCSSPRVYVLCQIPFPCAWRNLCQILIHQSTEGSTAAKVSSVRGAIGDSRRAVQRRRGFSVVLTMTLGWILSEEKQQLQRKLLCCGGGSWAALNIKIFHTIMGKKCDSQYLRPFTFLVRVKHGLVSNVHACALLVRWATPSLWMRGSISIF